MYSFAKASPYIEFFIGTAVRSMRAKRARKRSSQSAQRYGAIGTAVRRRSRPLGPFHRFACETASGGCRWRATSAWRYAAPPLRTRRSRSEAAPSAARPGRSSSLAVRRHAPAGTAEAPCGIPRRGWTHCPVRRDQSPGSSRQTVRDAAAAHIRAGRLTSSPSANSGTDTSTTWRSRSNERAPCTTASTRPSASCVWA
jgi:hypothetical protein